MLSLNIARVFSGGMHVWHYHYPSVFPLLHMVSFFLPGSLSSHGIHLKKINFPICQADNRKRYKEENNDHLDDANAANLAWHKHKQLNESIIVALFQGQFKSTVQCLSCHKKSRTFEAFMNLSLPLASTSKCSLQVSCLNYILSLVSKSELFSAVFLFLISVS